MRFGYVGHSLNSLKEGGYIGATIGVTKGDTRSLDAVRLGMFRKRRIMVARRRRASTLNILVAISNTPIVASLNTDMITTTLVTIILTIVITTMISISAWGLWGMKHGGSSGCSACWDGI